MGKAVVKLYRYPEQAKKALEELLKQGYPIEEISLVAGAGSAGQVAELKGGITVELPQGPALAAGPVARAVDNDSLESALGEVLGVPEDSLGYYQFGLATGGVLVSVHAEEEKLSLARRILREAEQLVVEKAHSPGFDRAARMTSSEPVDAKMTGDFRRY